jgi:hypothetical protein
MGWMETANNFWEREISDRIEAVGLSLLLPVMWQGAEAFELLSSEIDRMIAVQNVGDDIRGQEGQGQETTGVCQMK